ncbi:MAG: phytoene desaturase family protein [Bacteroidota bacterium]|nr:phytoene desaturase family protein [Bacteroidota bacterium]
MSDKKSAIIIGAGIGGIATGIYLARNGYEVRIYEKTASPGGRCGQTIREGHRFDLGATMFLMPSVYRDVFASLGLKLEEDFEIAPLSTMYKLYFQDGSVLPFSTDDEVMRSFMEKMERGSFKKLQSYVSLGYQFFRCSIKDLIGRNFYKWSEFITVKNVLLLIRLRTYLKHSVFIKKYFHHPNLRMAFTFQNIYIGQNPFQSPALFSMLSATELKEGSFSIQGGMYSIVEKLVATATSLGVDFQYKNPVSEIIVLDHKATGVVLNDGNEINADIVIANADLPYVYRELLPDKKTSSRIDKMSYACSAMVFHWGLDKVYPQLGHHSVFFSKGYRSSMKMIFKKKALADHPNFYVHAPVRSDPKAAPEGQDTLSVVVPAGHLDEHHDHDWNKIKNTARASIINRLKQLGMEDIEEHIKFEICYLPHTWKSVYNVSRGAVFGSLSHRIFQMGYFRPHNRHNRYRNLYFVGGSTHPGNGIPLVLMSAKLTSERILKDAKGL